MSARDGVRVPVVLQFQAAECALAALAMLMAHHGRAVPLEELRRAAGPGGEGTSLATLRNLAADHGFTARAFRKEEPDLADLAPPFMAFVDFNHMLVVEAVAPRHLRVVDPASGRRLIPRTEFERGFTGIVLRLDPRPGLTPRRAVPPRALPALLRRQWGWGGVAALAALATGAALASAAAGLDRDTTALGPPLLAVAAWAALVAALETWGASLHRAAATLVDRLLPGRDAGFHALRDPSMLVALAQLPQRLARLARGGPASALAGLLVGLPPLALLAAWWPTAGILAALAWVGCAALTLRATLAAGAPWRRLLLESGPLPLAERMRPAEPWQVAGRDDEALAAALAASCRARAPADAMARAEALLLGGLCAAAATAIWAAAALHPGQMAPPVLAALACLPWLRLPRALPAFSGLRQMAGGLDDLAAAAEPPAVPPGPAPLHATGLGFAPLFHDLSLTLATGARIGLTGPAGSGKTVLARLLSGRMAAHAGRVTAAGPVALVPSSAALFPASVLDNVVCWRPGIGRAGAEDALRAAGLWDDIAARPGGLDAPVAEGAANWSGGQCRRLMLARALADNPAAVVLDETLDAVDVAAERAILERLRARGVAVLLISQRPDSLRGCDAAWCLADGALVPWRDGLWAAGGRPLVLPSTPAAPSAPPPGDTAAPCPAGLRPLTWQARLRGQVLHPIDPQDGTCDGTVLAQDGHAYLVLPRTGAPHGTPPTDRAILVAAVLAMGSGAAVALAGSALGGGALGIAVAAWVLARRRLAARLDLAGTLAVALHALSRSPWWSRRHTAERLQQWCEDWRGLGSRRAIATAEAAAFALLLLALAALTHPVAVAAAGLGGAVAALAAGRLAAALHRRAWPRRTAAQAMLEPLLTLTAWAPATAATWAAHAAWRRRERAVGRAALARRAVLALRDGGRWLAPAVLCLWPEDWGLAAALALVPGNALGDALDRLFQARRDHAALAPFRAAPAENQGAPPERPPVSLRLESVSFGYECTVLNGVSLAVAPGEVVALAGPSGGGKSTLLRLMMGTEAPQAGQVLMNGRDLRQCDRLAWRAHTAAIIQDEVLDLRPLHAHVRGLAPLDLGAVAAWLDRLGAWDWVERLPMGLASLSDGRMLSGARAAQVLLARALCRRPSLLFLDETLAALDPEQRRRALAVIRASGATCVLVSHQPDVLAEADRVLWLEDGRLHDRPGAGHGATIPVAEIAAAPHAPFGAAARLYRPAALARIDGPDRRDVPPPPPPRAAPVVLAALLTAVLALVMKF